MMVSSCSLFACVICGGPPLLADSVYLLGVVADKMFHFTCFNTDDPYDPSVGLVHGDLAIPGVLLRREVFDPVVHEVGT